MKSILYLLFFFTVINSSIFAQNRYKEIISDSVVKWTIPYGNVDNENLMLDLYIPVKDTCKNRPLLIWAHGGAFVLFNREMPFMQNMCTHFAKLGYVTASIDYRKGLNKEYKGREDILSMVIHAVQDAKASVRYFRKSYAELNNPFGIDTSQIYFGGSSAGAITGLHMAYLNEQSELDEIADAKFWNKIGGLEGNSGNSGYSSQIKGVINLCGAIGNANWMKHNDIPVISVHGTKDRIVPFDNRKFKAFDLEMQGFCKINAKSEELCINNGSWIIENRGHTPYKKDETLFNELMSFLNEKIYMWVCEK